MHYCLCLFSLLIQIDLLSGSFFFFDCNGLQHVRVFVKSEDRVVPQNYSQVISHTHTCSCIPTSIVVFLNWFCLSHTWAQKCTKPAPKFDTVGRICHTVERRDGSTNVTRGSIPGVGVMYGLSLL